MYWSCPCHAIEYSRSGGSEESAGILPECDRVRAPQQFSRMSTVSVLTLDMTGPLSKGNALALFGAGETVYASTSSLYAATVDYPDIVFLEDGAVEQDDEVMERIEGGTAQPRVPSDRDFDQKPIWARTLVISAGVIMNLICNGAQAYWCFLGPHIL